MSYGVGRRHGSDLALLCLWSRPAATALIRPLAWETSICHGCAPKKTKDKKKKKLQHKLAQHINQLYFNKKIKNSKEFFYN